MHYALVQDDGQFVIYRDVIEKADAKTKPAEPVWGTGMVWNTGMQKVKFEGVGYRLTLDSSGSLRLEQWLPPVANSWPCCGPALPTQPRGPQSVPVGAARERRQPSRLLLTRACFWSGSRALPAALGGEATRPCWPSAKNSQAPRET